jgi:putative transposase
MVKINHFKKKKQIMKPAVYSQLYIQMVFSPRGRNCCLREEIQDEIFRYISGTITNKKHKSINVNGMPDHIHILVGLNPSESISDLVADIKRSSSLHINEKKLITPQFNWQEGYGVFSYNKSQLSNVYKYIENQKKHHQKMTFREEYLDFLHRNDIPFDERFLFEFYD